MKRLAGLAAAAAFLGAFPASAEDAAPFRIQLDTIHRGYDGQTCWVHPRAGAIPGATPGVVLTMRNDRAGYVAPSADGLR